KARIVRLSERGIQASPLVKDPGSLLPGPCPEQRHDPLPGFQVDDWGIFDRVVELAELAKDTVHPLVVVQVGRSLAEQVEGVVLPLVPPLVLAAEPPLEGLLGGRLDPVAGLLSHATQAQRPARAPRRRRG